MSSLFVCCRKQLTAPDKQAATGSNFPPAASLSQRIAGKMYKKSNTNCPISSHDGTPQCQQNKKVAKRGGGGTSNGYYNQIKSATPQDGTFTGHPGQLQNAMSYEYVDESVGSTPRSLDGLPIISKITCSRVTNDITEMVASANGQPCGDRVKQTHVQREATNQRRTLLPGSGSQEFYDAMIEDSVKKCEDLQNSLDNYISEISPSSMRATKNGRAYV